MAGGTSRVLLNPGTPNQKEVRAFSDDNVWQHGDLVRICTAGGGGWGDPLDREVSSVGRDVRGGFVTVESARRDYGVVVDENTMLVDARATEALRQDIRRVRGPPKLFHRFIYFDDEAEELEWVRRRFPR